MTKDSKLQGPEVATTSGVSSPSGRVDAGGARVANPAPGASPLSPQQRAVLQLHAYGKTRDKTAAWLGLSPNTVKTHDHAILMRLKAQNMEHAVAIALRAGWIE